MAQQTCMTKSTPFNLFLLKLVFRVNTESRTGGSPTCAPMWTLAEEGGHTVVAGGAVVAGCAGTVINVLAAVVARPAVDAHTVVAAVRVVACSSILACIGH